MTATTTGRLKIGDQWNAINIIAQSQTHPLKAVCELTENAIDAGGRRIEIVRRKLKGQIFLEVHDDGEGVRPNGDGRPDFAHIATHICDSMKRHLDARQRQGVHGEFGIGLLSFWSLGEELRMASAGEDGRLWEMTMLRGEPKYSVKAVRNRMNTGGTRVVIGPLLEATRKVVTGEKLQKYLAAELAGRIRDTQAEIHINDRVSRKSLDVQPREFDGERLDLPLVVHSPDGDLRVELYLTSEGSTEAEVALCKDGTRVFRSLDELPYFQRTPWTGGRLQGILDFPTLKLAPGTRHGVVPDEHLDAFIEAVQSLEPAIAEAVESYDHAEAEKASEKILKSVHKAFKRAIQELPENDYLFFDIPKPSETNGNDGSGGVALGKKRVRVALAADGNVRLFPKEPGPLAEVLIRPRSPRRKPGESCRLSARATDVEGIEIAHGISYGWRLQAGTAELSDVQGDSATVTSHAAGNVVVEVTARQGERTATARVAVHFADQVNGHTPSKGLPSYRLLHEPRSPHRSHYDPAANEITINSAHRDFIASRATNAKHRRYIGKLYAKEVVLLNFPHETPDNVTERLIEMLVRTEDVL